MSFQFKYLTLIVIVMFSNSLVPVVAQATDKDDPEEIQCWDASIYDQDNDGYAELYANKSDRVTFTVMTEDSTDSLTVSFKNRMTCPEGWVKSRGDCDDNNPNIHPRRWEIYGNGQDDNCNGLNDEPEFYYMPGGNDNLSSSFDMTFFVNDPIITSVHKNPLTRLKVEVEYQKLSNTASSYFSGKKSPKSFAAFGPFVFGEINLSGLRRTTVYRARIQFYSTSALRQKVAKKYPVYTKLGDKSEWYYTTTTGPNQVSQARTKILLQGFFEYSQSTHLGLVGYRGRTDRDGTHYTASLGEAWCSEFYSWVAGKALTDMAGRHWVGDMQNYFTGESEPSDDMIHNDIRRADYLGEASSGDIEDMHHSSMFLAYDSSLDQVWTLGGNTTGYNRINGEDYFGSNYHKRRAGKEVFIQPIDLSRIVYWGKIKRSMLRD